MSKQRIEIEVDVPEGWEAVAEYRCPHEKEPHLTASGVVVAPYAYSEAMAIPLRRVEPVKESRWIVGWRSCTSVNRAQLLTDASGCDSAAVIRIDYENGHPVSVALESVEGKG